MPPIDFAVSYKEMISTTEKIGQSGETIKSYWLLMNKHILVTFFLFLTNYG